MFKNNGHERSRWVRFGTTIVWGSTVTRFSNSAMEAEGKALLVPMQHAPLIWSMGITHIVFEGDSNILIAVYGKHNRSIDNILSDTYMLKQKYNLWLIQLYKRSDNRSTNSVSTLDNQLWIPTLDTNISSFVLRVIPSVYISPMIFQT